MDKVRVLSVGNIGSVSTGGMYNSSVFAGVKETHDTNAADGVLDLPTPGTDLYLTALSRASIKSVQVKGVDDLAGYVDSFINSNLAAAEFGTVSIAYAKTHNGGTKFGLAADYVKTLTTKDDVGTDTYTDLNGPPDSQVWDDAQIRII